MINLKRSSPLFPIIRHLPTAISDVARAFRAQGKSVKPSMVDSILDKSAIKIDFSNYYEDNLITDRCPIKNLYVNQLAANNPLEDRWNVGFTQVDGVVSSFLFTILDGHSGPACSHAVAWAVLDYVGASCLQNSKLEAVLEYWDSNDVDQPYHIARRLDLFNKDGKRGHAASPPPNFLRYFLRYQLRDYIKELIAQKDRSFKPEECMTQAIQRLDDTLCSLGHLDKGNTLPPKEFFTGDHIHKDLIHVVLSGAVGQVGRIFWQNDKLNSASNSNTIDLHLANVGDCGAVLVSESKKNELQGDMLNQFHQGSNNHKEAARIAKEHPNESINSILRNGGRLLGELAPSRAWGDVRYKWPADRILELLRQLGVDSVNTSTVMQEGPWSGLTPLATPYLNPPYLTAKPEMHAVSLTSKSRYLILATDGLWEIISAEKAADILSNLKPGECPATKLLRCALTSIPTSIAKVIGNEHKGSKEAEREASLSYAAALLSLPAGVARYYRDDITVLVMELDV